VSPNSDAQDERLIVDAARTGDEQALSELYTRSQSCTRSIFPGSIGTYLPARATHMTLRIWRKRSSFASLRRSIASSGVKHLSQPGCFGSRTTQ
jgi:hypothetical protein